MKSLKAKAEEATLYVLATLNSQSHVEDLPILIDDIDDALACLTDLGREVICPFVGALRDGILFVASLRRWQVVAHSSFRSWIASLANLEDHWLVLDPLIHESLMGSGAQRLRFTRRRTASGWVIDEAMPREVEARLYGRRVGIVDDAAVTGTTLRHVLQAVRAAGGIPGRIVVCVSSGNGRSAVVGVEWHTYAAGSFRVAHMRDGCLLLPYAGRPLLGREPIEIGARAIPVRVPPGHGGLWDELRRYAPVAQAMKHIRVHFADRLSAALGRTALVRDVALLGDGVCLPSFRAGEYHRDAPISAFM
jgi:hypothetical protein